MSNHTALAASLAATLMLAACVTSPLAIGDAGSLSDNQRATLIWRGYDPAPLHETFTFRSVDCFSVPWETFGKAERYLTPGPHIVLAVGTRGTMGIGGLGLMEAFIVFDVEAGRRYQIEGNRDRHGVEFWVEDVDSGEIISEIVKTKWKDKTGPSVFANRDVYEAECKRLGVHE